MNAQPNVSRQIKRSLLALLAAALIVAACASPGPVTPSPRPATSAPDVATLTPLPPPPASPSLPPTTEPASPAASSTAGSTPSATPAAPPVHSMVLSGHTGPVTNLAWSPDGTLLATSSGEYDSPDNTLRLWRADGTLVTILRAHAGPVVSLSWSPDGKMLASGSLDGTIRLWQSNGTPVSTLSIAKASRDVRVVWSPTGQVIASSSDAAPGVQLWRPDGTWLATLSVLYGVYNLAWSPDGKFLLAGIIDYQLWRADGAQVFHLQSCSHCTPAWGMAWSPDSQMWAVGNESGEVAIYDTQGRRVAAMQSTSGNVDTFAWSPDGRTLAGGDGVTLWHADGTLLAKHPDFGRVQSLAWSPDGQVLASASDDGVVRLWSADGRAMFPLPGNDGPGLKVAWSPRGQLLAAASKDGTVRLWTLTVTPAQLFQSMAGDVYQCPLTVPGPERPSDPTSYSFGAYWYKSPDGLIWASPGENLHVGDNKVGWSRPVGAELQVSGQRLDRDSPPLVPSLPCCFPDNFQASGLNFPSEGCWQITARTGASELRFVVSVGPAPSPPAP